MRWGGMAWLVRMLGVQWILPAERPLQVILSTTVACLLYSRYVDVEEEETTLIAMSIKDLQLARQGKWGVFNLDGLRPGCYGDTYVAGEGWHHYL